MIKKVPLVAHTQQLCLPDNTLALVNTESRVYGSSLRVLNKYAPRCKHGITQPMKHEQRIWRMQEKCCGRMRSKDLKIPKQLIYPKEKSVLAAG